MLKAIKLILAIIGGVICIVTAFLYWKSRSTCGLLDFVLILLILLGLTGLTAVIQSARSTSLVWSTLIWVVCGGLIALMFIAVMSIGPLVFAAALAFLGAALLSRQKKKPKILTSLGIVLTSSLVFFSSVYMVVTSIGFETVELPQGTFAARAFSTIDYTDAFRVKVPKIDSKQVDIVSAARLFLISLLPCWADTSKKDTIQSITFEPGLILDHWRVFHKSSNEIVVGFDRSFIDFRVSVLLSEENRNQWVTVATVARYNNWKGRVYFIPVRFGHRIIFADIMRKMKESFHKGIRGGNAEKLGN
jgi:hypothetical protein